MNSSLLINLLCMLFFWITSCEPISLEDLCILEGKVIKVFVYFGIIEIKENTLHLK